MKKVNGVLARHKSKLILFVFDSTCLILAGIFSLLLRFDGMPEAALVIAWLTLLPFALPLHLLVYYRFGLYSQVWRYAGFRDLTKVATAVLTATLLLLVLVPILSAKALPGGIIMLSCCFNLAGVSGTRMLSRLRAESKPLCQTKGSRTLILGAGDAGSLLTREIYKHPELDLWPVGFLDDDRRKVGQRVCGLPVLGALDQLEDVSVDREIETVIIAMPSVSARLIKQLAERCASLGIKPKTVPGFFEILSGRQEIAQIRDVQIEDLLPRKRVQMDSQELMGYLQGKTVLVTGAGGSIGSELCRQAASSSADHLLLLGHGEDSVYRIYRQLSKDYPQTRLSPIIADVRDQERITGILAKHQPDVVFHAAAHKHVPLMEQNPEDAVSNNVLGTLNVAMAASQYGVQSFVMLSTDKAVNPVSAMGATKRLAELLLQSFNEQSSTRFVTVRFGNVLGSRGSVIPLFQEQIARGGPVTVTHPEMTRYFMTIPEAVSLVMQAGAMGKGGEVFILDMGQPVRILDLVHDLIQLSGYRPDVDIPVVFVGSRPGEKIHEELVGAQESAKPTQHPQILVIRRPSIDSGAMQRVLHEISRPEVSGSVGRLIALANQTVDSSTEQEVCHD